MGKCEVRKEYRDRGEELVFLLAGEQSGNSIIRKERKLNKRISLLRKHHVTSQASTSSCSGYLLLYNNAIKICVFSENKYPPFLPQNNEFVKEF